MPKIEPAVTTLWYSVADGVSYVDIAKDLSMVNRRLYRQGYAYAIQEIQVALMPGMKVTDVWQGAFSVIPNSYIAHNAWKKAFHTWKDMQDEYMDGMGERLKGKWADFKIYLDDSHAGGTTLTPVAGDGGAYSTGEWIYSNFVYDDAGTTRSPTIHMIGTSTDDSAIGLIEAYGDSRNYVISGPGNPSEMATGFYAQFHGVGDIDDELGNDLRDDNDLPPYDQDDYPGGHSNADTAQLVRLAAVSASESISLVPGFVAPCGLIRISTNEAHTVDGGGSQSDAAGSTYAFGTAATALIGITVAVGPYRGVLATPMGQ